MGRCISDVLFVLFTNLSSPTHVPRMKDRQNRQEHLKIKGT